MVNDATRDRVLAAADRLGYVANGAARALVERRTGTIGALIPRYGPSSFPMMVQGLENTLAEHGYTMLLSAPDHRRAGDPSALRRLLERGVDAVVLLGSDQPAAFFSMLAAHRTPFVMVWAEGSPQGFCIGYDEHAAATLVVDHLAGLGHRRLGFIGGRNDDNARARRRFEGVTAAIAGHGMVLDADAVVQTDYGFREGFEAMQGVLARRTGISALICGNDYLAAGALSALGRAGVAVPETVAVASFNDNDFSAYLHPPLTTVRAPIRAMGEAAATHLIDILSARAGGSGVDGSGADGSSADGNEATLRRLTLPVELVVRASTGVPVGRKPRAR